MSFVMFICIMLSVTLWIMGKGWRHSDGAYGASRCVQVWKVMLKTLKACNVVHHCMAQYNVAC
jgi:hypothetical protein